MVRKQTRCKNQIKSILFFYGILIPEEGHWSRKFINWIETISMERASGDLVLKAHLEELKYLRQIIAGLNKTIRALSRTDTYRDKVLLLRTVPGISTLTAMTLLTELCDISRFSSLDKLASYAGLVPSVSISGKYRRHGSITKEGSRWLRWIMVESIHTHLKYDTSITRAYHAIAERKGAQIAKVAAARRLLMCCFSVLRNREPYHDPAGHYQVSS
jgi:transposase